MIAHGSQHGRSSHLRANLGRPPAPQEPTRKHDPHTTRTAGQPHPAHTTATPQTRKEQTAPARITEKSGPSSRDQNSEMEKEQSSPCQPVAAIPPHSTSHSDEPTVPLWSTTRTPPATFKGGLETNHPTVDTPPICQRYNRSDIAHTAAREAYARPNESQGCGLG